MAVTIPTLPMSGVQLKNTLDGLRQTQVFNLASKTAVIANPDLQPGDLCQTPESRFVITTPGSMAVNGTTVTAMGSGIGLAVLGPTSPLASVAALLADTRPQSWFTTGDCIRVPDVCNYTVVDPAGTDYELLTAGGVKLRADCASSRCLSALALGCDVVSSAVAAQSAEDATAKIQSALDRGYDVSIGGWVNIAGRLVVDSARLVGSGRRLSGLWASTPEAGVTLLGIGGDLRSLSILSDYTATHLLVIGDGIQGSTNDCTVDDITVSGARDRCLLVREYANGEARFSKFRLTGGRTGTTSIEDPNRHTAEVRCIFKMIGCDVSGGTGWSLLLSGEETWEEARLFFVGGRIQSSAAGLVKVVGYNHNHITTAIFDNVYFENPGITGNPGVNNPNAGAAIVAQGPGAFVNIRSYQKASCRKAPYFLGAYDGARLRAPLGGPVHFQALGGAAPGRLFQAATWTPLTFASGIDVCDPGILVNNGGTVYAPRPDLVPFTTTATFDAAQWTATGEREPGALVMEGMPPIRSSDSEEFSLTDWTELGLGTPRINRMSFDFRDKQLVTTLLDGTSTAPILSANPSVANGTVLGTTTAAGEFLSKGSAVTMAPSANTTPASYRIQFTVTPDLVGQIMMITAAWAYRQVGATFGSAGSVRARLKVEDGTASAFPSNGQSPYVDVVHSGGDGTVTPWYKGGHVFRPSGTGTLTFLHTWDTNTVSRDDVCLIDNVKLWVIQSFDSGSWV
ncbi:hypothetical protein [Chachezhania sediminis]|uniref:hypothetical protein n=1 Tax=Chachezhania sediminis TaxID=2599291 RepID=UPI00131C05C2|nr:hypothetical protein [Chachezhania sediminis]